MRFSTTLILALAGLTQAAHAHVVMKDFEARASYQEVLTLIVPHGCGASPTTEVRMKVPDGIAIVVPQPVAGWDLTVTTRRLDKPIPFEGGRMLTEVPDEIIWKGTLPSTQLGLFTFLARMPDKVGGRVYFKTIQRCAQGEERWVETVGDNEEIWRVWLKKAPSPFVVLKEAPPQLGVDMATMAKARKEGQAQKP